MSKITTIKISMETKDRLSKLKEHDKESYEQILKKVLYVLNLCKKNPEKSQKLLIGIDKRIRRKNIYTKRFG
jgi:hypothetical protein